MALSLMGLLLGPLGNGVAAAAYTTTVTNPTSSFAAASSFCASPGTTTVNANADSTVTQSSPAANSGNATTLSVVSAASNQRTLVNFALPALPSHCTVTTAQLTLTVVTGNATRTLSVTPAPTAWSEATVTWNNQPAINGTASTAAAVTTGPLSFTVTNQVRAMYTGAKNGFTVKDQTESSGNPAKTQTFASREGVTAPKLTVTFG